MRFRISFFSSFPRPLFRQDDLLDEKVNLEPVLVEAVPGRRPDRHLLRVRVAGVARVRPVEVHHQGALLDLVERKFIFLLKILGISANVFVGKMAGSVGRKGFYFFKKSFLKPTKWIDVKISLL